MIASIVVIASIALVLFVYLWAAGRRDSRRNLDELAAQLRTIDVDAFRNLIDEREESFLRERLPSAEFRSVHRERMLAAVEYVWGAARNAGILIRLAQAAQLNSDPTVSIAAERLLDNAVKVRMYAFQTIPRLYISMLLPSVNHVPRSLAERYDTATRQMVTLRCLSSPVGKVSAAT